jgi:hypothetical protein
MRISVFCTLRTLTAPRSTKVLHFATTPTNLVFSYPKRPSLALHLREMAKPTAKALGELEPRLRRTLSPSWREAD